VSKDETAGYFDDAPRDPSPSGRMHGRKAVVGDKLEGTIVDKYKMDRKVFGKDEVMLDRDGNPEKQLVIVLQTEHRDWENVAKPPKDKDGNDRPASEDTGKRSIFAPKGTNVYAAIAEAIRNAKKTDDSIKDLEVGGKLAVQFYEEEDTGKGNPLKKHRAKYKAPVVDTSDDWADGEVADEAERSAKPTSSARPPADDEPPF
jgi:hypothetical protein